ncbi:MAG: deoxyribonuclease V [Dehalococcoidia bacterium]|nr:deoxyribonuclease V [Dehalococcoidia bacterium]
MKVRTLHSWQVNPAEAREIQCRLASQVSRRTELVKVEFIAGVDVSTNARLGLARAAVVILRFPDLTVEEYALVEEPIAFPYVPGLLSFREAPSILKAFEGLKSTPDLVMVDGQGIAHPRRMGLASHLGLLLDLPVIGCAKSILVGQHGDLPEEQGSLAYLIDGDDVVGAAVRTRKGVKPVYVSIGNKIDLPTAIGLVNNCCRHYRLPEPTRLAHLAAAGRLPTNTRS